MTRAYIIQIAFLCFAFCLFSTSPLSAASIPATQATALDGHTVALPRDLSAATILIVGFGRHSSDATTAWEKPTRAQFAHAPGIAFYDMAMLAEVPHFARGFALSRIRKAVPDVLKPNFLPLFDREDEWKQAAAFDTHQEDAAYVLLVDQEGRISLVHSSTFHTSPFRSAHASSSGPRFHQRFPIEARI